MNNTIMHIGIMSRDAFCQRTLAVAQGRYKPRKNEPKVWFESLQSLAQVLSKENRELLRIIIEHKPQSLAELEKLSSRNKSNLSRTLRTLEQAGVIELPRDAAGRLAPVVKATEFRVEFDLGP